MKIGDKVRFLSEVGGGRVTAFRGKDVVMVEDADGFEIPMPVRECVVVGEAEAPAQEPRTKTRPAEEARPAQTVRIGRGRDAEAMDVWVAYTAEGENPARFVASLVNDSAYDLGYAYMHQTEADKEWYVCTHGTAPAGTKVRLEEFGLEQLANRTRTALLLMPYKEKGAFALKPAMTAEWRTDAAKFARRGSFGPSDYFDQPAMMVPVVRDGVVAKPAVTPDADVLREAMMGRQDIAAPRPRDAHRPKEGETVEVDLHAHALLETTAGMGPADILHYQLDYFRETMEQYRHRPGTRIVFIHGKGEGVLRKALTDELRKRYKECTWQDASFAQYGFGATLVVVHALSRPK